MQASQGKKRIMWSKGREGQRPTKRRREAVHCETRVPDFETSSEDEELRSSSEEESKETDKRDSDGADHADDGAITGYSYGARNNFEPSRAPQLN